MQRIAVPGPGEISDVRPRPALGELAVRVDVQTRAVRSGHDESDPGVAAYRWSIHHVGPMSTADVYVGTVTKRREPTEEDDG